MNTLLNDPERLKRLRELGLLDETFDAALDRITRLASKILNAPVSLLSLVEPTRQYFKSYVGLGEPWATQRETPLTHSFCQHVVTSGQPLIVNNAPEHEVVKDNLAIPDLGVIAYAGIPIHTADNQQLGSFCVIDIKPREWTADELEILEGLAALLMTEINLREEILARERETQAREKLQQQVIDIQRNLLEELSTPLIPLNDEIVVMPLIGALDSYRANTILETLLQGVSQQQAQVVIVDITGVPIIDTHVAGILLQASQAVQLLGAQVMLTGIRPEIAQTLVSLGIDLRNVTTYSDLQQGVTVAMARQQNRSRSR